MYTEKNYIFMRYHLKKELQKFFENNNSSMSHNNNDKLVSLLVIPLVPGISQKKNDQTSSKKIPYRNFLRDLRFDSKTLLDVLKKCVCRFDLIYFLMQFCSFWNGLESWLSALNILFDAQKAK